MRNAFSRFSAAALFLVVALLCSSAHTGTRGIRLTTKQGESLDLYSDYRALVVGVGKYSAGWPDLPGALKDSEDVAGALKDMGFSVKSLPNPNSRQLRNALAELAFQTGGDPNRGLIFYFAGHGETLTLADGTKLGYIIPSDCPLKSADPMAFDDLAISMKDIEGMALKVRSKHLLMVFDSCFSGSIFNLTRAAPVEITEKSTLPVRQFITAGAEGEQVPDRSVFKQVFLDGIRLDGDLNRDGYVTASELGMYLQGKVVNYTRGGQHPQYGKINNPKLDKGDFVFVPVSASREQKAEASTQEQGRAGLSEELKLLQEERKKSQELLEQLKTLMEARLRSEDAERKTQEERKALEQKIQGSAEDRKATESRADERVKTLEAERKTVEDKLRKETEQRKTLEAELERTRLEQEKTLRTITEKENAKARELQTASLPKKAVEAAPPSGFSKDKGLKLAVFPMYIHRYEERFTEVLTKAAVVAARESGIFQEVSSFYPLFGEVKVEKIPGDISKQNTWSRKSFFSLPEPDLPTIYREGERLALDVVVLATLDPHPAQKMDNPMTCYLIDIRKRKPYVVTGTAGLTIPHSDIFKKVLEDYRKDLEGGK